MNKNGIKRCVIIFVVCLLVPLSVKAWAQDIYPSSPPLFTNQELDDILAPIALYPDPLLAQILPASTYTEEILDAYDWLNSGGSMQEIDLQRWDESVKAITRYPDVLQMMAENGDWTADLGDAFLNQPEDVTSAIQRLRWQARDMGNLESNSRQNIVIVGDYIEIYPVQPQYVYVPTYDPSVVYYERYYPGGDPFITFGVGLMIGSWLTMDFDWGNHHVIYHGWNRPGWVNHAKPYVHVKNLYVQRSRPFINKNWRHDNSHGNPDSFRTAHPGAGSGAGMKSRISEIRGRSVTEAKPKYSSKTGPAADKRSLGDRGKDIRGTDISRPANPPQDVRNKTVITIPDVSKRPAPRTPEVGPKPEMQFPGSGDQKPASRTSDISQKKERPSFGVIKGTAQTIPAGEGVQSSKTPSVTFGGYRGANEARGQSMRGQASRQSGEQARPSAAPATRSSASERKDVSGGNAPAGKGDAGNKSHR
jgi:hypothetical protein